MKDVLSQMEQGANWQFVDWKVKEMKYPKQDWTNEIVTWVIWLWQKQVTIKFMRTD